MQIDTFRRRNGKYNMNILITLIFRIHYYHCKFIFWTFGAFVWIPTEMWKVAQRVNVLEFIPTWRKFLFANHQQSIIQQYTWTKSNIAMCKPTEIPLEEEEEGSPLSMSINCHTKSRKIKRDIDRVLLNAIEHDFFLFTQLCLRMFVLTVAPGKGQ